VREIGEGNINDEPMLEMLDQILQEMHLYDKLLKFREALAAKNPSDSKLAQKLFQLYTYQNDFAKMSAKASQFEKALGNPQYGLYSVEALYLNS
jgi:protein involved in temperature-dependent protein secretion